MHLVLSTGFYSRSSGLDLPEARERVGFEVDLHYNGAMKLADRIEVNPEIAFGKPVVAGTRMAVGFILDLLAGGWDMTDILREYPHLKEEDVLACVKYAKEIVEEWKVFPLRVKNGGKSVHAAV